MIYRQRDYWLLKKFFLSLLAGLGMAALMGCIMAVIIYFPTIRMATSRIFAAILLSWKEILALCVIGIFGFQLLGVGGRHHGK